MRGDLARQDAGQVSLLVSRRGALATGDFGMLVNLVLQDRDWREDRKSSGVPLVRNDLVAGRAIVVPSSTSETTSAGQRRRGAASVLLEWRPTPAFDAYAEAHFAELKTVSFARDTVDRTHQLAAGGRWAGAGANVSADISHTGSFNNLFFSGPFFAGTAAQFSHDLSGRVPDSAVTGTDLADPANLRYTGLAYRTRPFRGDLLAARLDAEWQLDAGALERVVIGWRHARRRADNAPGLVFGDLALSGLTAADTPGRVLVNPYRNFLDGQAQSIRGHLVGDLGDARDPVALRQAFGITTPLPTQGSALGVWHIHERTEAACLQGGWRWPALPLDGQTGLRVVNTRTAVDGTQSVPASGTTAPIAIDSSTTDWLPSASLRWRAAHGLQLRAAASRTITRPDFNQLSPSLSLVPNPADPTLNQGSAGNPALRPLRASPTA